MTKGAVLMMTYSIAKDFIKQGVRCNCICPARVHTPFVDGYLAATYPGREQEMFQKLSEAQPIGRMAKPDEIAALALYLCSDEAAFITGSDYAIDGGFLRLNN
jgi:NAD(P)-dependent dehydrogenase (short-subunit alcohol dehydrogenase family)